MARSTMIASAAFGIAAAIVFIVSLIGWHYIIASFCPLVFALSVGVFLGNLRSYRNARRFTQLSTRHEKRPPR